MWIRAARGPCHEVAPPHVVTPHDLVCPRASDDTSDDNTTHPHSKEKASC